LSNNFTWPPEDPDVEVIDLQQRRVEPASTGGAAPAGNPPPAEPPPAPPASSSLFVREPYRDPAPANRVAPATAAPSFLLDGYRMPAVAARDAAAATPDRALTSSAYVAAMDDTDKIPPIAEAVAKAQTRRRRITLSSILWKLSIPVLAALVAVEYSWLFNAIPAISPAWVDKLPEPTVDVTSPPPSAKKPRTAGSRSAAATSDTATEPAVQTAAATRPESAAVPGSVSIPLPIQVQIFEHGRFVGTNDGLLPITAGRHDLELVNQSLNFSTIVPVDIEAGRGLVLRVVLPAGKVSVTATPPAEVLIDGLRQGRTPLDDIPVPIGPHQVTFRHPELGEQTRSVVVTASSPQRISVDFRQPSR
jgi:hypothetical protein